jgi:hypothetical protein
MSNERQAILQERLKLNSNRRLNRTVARSLAPYHPGHEINEVRAEAAVIDKNNFSPLKKASVDFALALFFHLAPARLFQPSISIFRAHSPAHSLLFPFFSCVSHFSVLSVSSERTQVSLVCKMMIPLLITY